MSFEVADTVPAGWRSFDVAFSHEVLYLIHDLSAHAEAIFEALAPGSSYYAVMGVHAGSPLMVDWHRARSDELQLPKLYTIDEVVGVFGAAGFEVAARAPQDRFRSGAATRPTRRISSGGSSTTTTTSSFCGALGPNRRDESRHGERSVLVTTERLRQETAMPRITPNLWFDMQSTEAAEFYCSVFPNSKINTTTYYAENGPQPAGTVLTVDFELTANVQRSTVVRSSTSTRRNRS